MNEFTTGNPSRVYAKLLRTQLNLEAATRFAKALQPWKNGQKPEGCVVLLSVDPQ